MCEYLPHTMPTIPGIVIPFGQHFNFLAKDFEADGDPDNTEALQIGGTTTGLSVKVGNLTDNSQPESGSNTFTEDVAHGRIVRMGAIAPNGATGSLNVIAPGTPGPGQENIVTIPYTASAQPSQEHLESGGTTGPFPGV